MAMKVKAVEKLLKFTKNENDPGVWRYVITPDSDLKDELAKTAVQITCYDRTGKEVRRVTSTDEGTVEDPENTGGSDSPTNDGEGN